SVDDGYDEPSNDSAYGDQSSRVQSYSGEDGLNQSAASDANPKGSDACCFWRAFYGSCFAWLHKVCTAAQHCKPVSNCTEQYHQYNSPNTFCANYISVRGESDLALVTNI